MKIKKLADELRKLTEVQLQGLASLGITVTVVKPFGGGDGDQDQDDGGVGADDPLHPDG